MNNIKQLKNQQREKHPGFDSYLECMSRSFFAGLSTFVLGFSGTYFTQKLLANRLPYTRKFYIVFSAAFATVAAYKVTSDRTKTCQAAWLAAEDKHTSLQNENEN